MVHYFHHLTLSVFCNKTEDQNIDAEIVAEAIQDELDALIFEVSGIPKTDFHQKGIVSEIVVHKAEEDFLEDLYEVKVSIEKKPEIIMKGVIARLSSEDKIFLKKTMESRIDDQGLFFIRLDKKSLIESDPRKYILTDSGHCIHIKAKVAAYPQKKENALAKVEAFMGIIE